MQGLEDPELGHLMRELHVFSTAWASRCRERDGAWGRQRGVPDTPWEKGKRWQRQVQSLTCLCAEAVCVTKSSLRGQDLPAGQAGEPERERCLRGGTGL